MTHHNAGTEPTLFSALITPHRSLGGTGFFVLMLLVCAVSFVAGLVFAIVGAWPVVGFFGLDVVLIYWAFRANYRSARAFEEVTVTPSALTLRKVSGHRRVREWTLNPRWVRLDRQTHGEFGLQRLFLVSHGKRLAIADCLGAAEKESFAAALAAALAEAKGGTIRLVVK